MTRAIRKHWPVVGALTAIVIAAAAVLPLVAERAETRRIVLVAKGMSFVLEGESSPNPVLRMRAGEQVEIVLRNETPGIVHDLAIPQLNAATARVPHGSEATLVIKAPDTPGRYEYQCRPHAQMMRGVIEVAAP